MSDDTVPAVGDAVLDAAGGRAGRVTSSDGLRVRLRPLGGGAEWDAAPSGVRRLGQDELLRALVREANARSRQAGPGR